jgi:hypothetical protein
MVRMPMKQKVVGIVWMSIAEKATMNSHPLVCNSMELIEYLTF